MAKTKKTAKKAAQKAKPAKTTKPAKKAASVKVRDLALDSGKKGAKAADVRGGDGTTGGSLQAPGSNLQLGRTALRDLGGDRSTSATLTRVVDGSVTTEQATSGGGGAQAYPTPVFSR